MANLNLGCIYLKIDKSISLSLDLYAKKSSIAKLLPLKNTNTNTNKSKKIRLPLAQNQKQSRFINKGCLVSFCESLVQQHFKVRKVKQRQRYRTEYSPWGINIKIKSLILI